MNTVGLRLTLLHQHGASDDYLARLRGCGREEGAGITLDRESECGKALLREYDVLRGKRKAPPAKVEAVVPVKVQPVKSKGFGDTIAKITKAVGIKECGGCARRRALLNKVLPYQQADEPRED